jgi:transglutaminase-like putative cysteine protease
VRFGLVHRIMTDTLAVLGLLALLTSGELSRGVSITILVGLVLALVVPDSFQERPSFQRFGVVAPLLLLAVQSARLFSGESLLSVAIEFAAGLQVLRLSSRRGAAHDQQVIVLALLHLIAGTVLGSGLTYGLCFLGFLVVTPGALVLSHLRREVEGNYRQGARDRTGLPVDVPRILRSRRVIGRQFLLSTCLLAIPIFVFTGLLFVLFPRVGLSLLLLNHSRPERMVGFSERVDLGGVGKLRLDPTIVMRVVPPELSEPPAPRMAFYLRGAAFDRYDGRSWSRTVRGSEALADQSGEYVRLRRFPDANDRVLDIDLEPIEPPVVFIPPDAVALRVFPVAGASIDRVPQVLLGQEGGLRYRSVEQRGLRYQVSLASRNERAPGALSPFDRERYLSLPNLSPRVEELAREWTAAAKTPREMADAIERRLRKDYRYDLDSPSGAEKNPLEHFLFQSKRGHCEFYSTAMTMLLRTLDVPARNATGFVGGTFNRFSRSYVVRQGDAHSWVEVHLDGHGWTRFDPTPPSDAAPRSEITGVLALVRDLVEALGQRWSDHVVGYDLRQQIGLYQEARRAFSKLVPSDSVVGKLSASPRKVLLAALAIAGIAFGVRELLRRRKQGAPEKQAEERERRAHLAIELYLSLERAMAAHNIARPSSTPPLAHARALADLGHPLGTEVLDLTEVYLRARFGGEPVDSTARRTYQDRVRALRTTRVEPRPAQPEAPAS